MTAIRRLLKVTLRPTSECNRGCSDCYDNATPIGCSDEFTEEQEEVLVNEVSALVEKGVRVLIHITGGGEPLLYPRFAPLVESMLGAGALVSFTTSGCTGSEGTALDLNNLLQVSKIRGAQLQPILSSKVTLPSWRTRFRFSVALLSEFSEHIVVRHTIHKKGEMSFWTFLSEQGFRQVESEGLVGTLPPAFFRKDLIVPGAENSQILFRNEQGTFLRLVSHKVIRAGRAKRNGQVIANGIECPLLMGHGKPYLDIWPNSAIYPCFVIGPEIPKL